MITLKDWIMDLAENYGVHQFDDVESGTFVAHVKKDIYLMNHADVKK